MSQKLPNMLESTIQKIKEMVDVNSAILFVKSVVETCGGNGFNVNIAVDVH